jgi:hypothetical protein
MITKDRFDSLYRKYHHRAFVHPDPLQFLYAYEDLRDREIVAFVASSLAYGRVSQIIKSISSVIERMTPSPWVFLHKASPERIRRTFSGFKHRFTTDENLCAKTIFPALCAFTEELAASADGPLHHLVPSPDKGSACKRLNLFLRWMVRQDEVDPGGWTNVSPSKLIVPVDTHMHRVSLFVGFTRRKQADLGAAMEITECFKAMAPEDPVKYDFSLTRLGIRGDKDYGGLLKQGREQKTPA